MLLKSTNQQLKNKDSNEKSPCFTPSLLFVLMTTCLTSNMALAGSLDSPGAVTNANSAMYTIDDIYNRLDAGTTGTKRSTTFTEPSSGPGSSSHSLNEVMSKAPALDNSSGASASEVANGKNFWGLKSGNWGEQTGTGTLASGDAQDSQVLSGKTYSNDSGNSVGTMPDSTQNITPGDSEKTIAQGYHDGTGKVATDANLTTDNIKNGITIFGVTGSFSDVGGNIQDTSSGDAQAGDILQGKKAWVDGSEVTGNVAAGANVNGGNGSKTFTIKQVKPHPMQREMMVIWRKAPPPQVTDLLLMVMVQ
jgi:hypothetical protein